jgi:hypothetical protein
MPKTRIRDWTITIFFGLAAILLQTTAAHYIFGSRLEINLIFGTIIWLAFYKNLIDGALLTFLLAFAQGSVSGTPSGIYMLAGLSLYLLCWMLRDRFAPKTLAGQFLFALGLGAFYKLVLLVSLRLFVGRYFFIAQPVGMAFLEVLLNAFFAPLIFLVFNRIKGFFDLFPDIVQPRRG